MIDFLSQISIEFPDFSILDEHKLILCFFIWLSTALWTSFCGMLVWRLPVIFNACFTDWTKGRENTETTIMGRSHCDSCHRTLTIIDLIPVVGWIIRKGQCPACHNKVSSIWPVMEATTGFIACGFMFLPLPFYNRIILWSLFLWLTLISWMDDRTEWLPDIFTFPVLFSGLLFSPISLMHSRVEGAVIGWIIMLLAMLYGCWRQNSWDYLSWGDVILCSALMAWLGNENIILFLITTCICAVIYICYLTIKERKGFNTPRTEAGQLRIPLAPAMCVASLICFILIQVYHVSII